VRRDSSKTTNTCTRSIRYLLVEGDGLAHVAAHERDVVEAAGHGGAARPDLQRQTRRTSIRGNNGHEREHTVPGSRFPDTAVSSRRHSVGEVVEVAARDDDMARMVSMTMSF
jgi:hypothetical protein